MGLLKADVANMALGLLGSTLSISDVDQDTSTQAKVVRRHYSSALESLLAMHPWGFATTVKALELYEECPFDGMFGYSYSYPSDCAIIQKIDVQTMVRDAEDQFDERTQYEESYDTTGTKILTNVGEAYARYTKLIDESEEMPNHFGRALAAKLAIDIAPSIITNNFAKVKNVLITDAERRINHEIAEDLNRKPRPIPSDSRFVRVR